MANAWSFSEHLRIRDLDFRAHHLLDCKSSSLEATVLNFRFPKFQVVSIVLFVSILLVFTVSYFLSLQWFDFCTLLFQTELRIWFFQIWEFFKVKLFYTCPFVHSSCFDFVLVDIEGSQIRQRAKFLERSGQY